jgi:isocitrate/isopropylmalate dehydrogenase
VHKANVVRATDGLFLEAAKAVAKDFHRKHPMIADR